MNNCEHFCGLYCHLLDGLAKKEQTNWHWKLTTAWDRLSSSCWTSGSFSFLHQSAQSQTPAETWTVVIVDETNQLEAEAGLEQNWTTSKFSWIRWGVTDFGMAITFLWMRKRIRTWCTIDNGVEWEQQEEGAWTPSASTITSRRTNTFYSLRDSNTWAAVFLCFSAMALISGLSSSEGSSGEALYQKKKSLLGYCYLAICVGKSRKAGWCLCTKDPPFLGNDMTESHVHKEEQGSHAASQLKHVTDMKKGK